MGEVSLLWSRAVLGGLAVIGLAAPPAAAQEEDPFAELVITAQKREEALQDVGISVTAYSGEQLEALGVTETTQITQQIPGLRLNAWSPNVTIFNLRGVSQNNFTDNLEAPIAVYLDNAYMGSINGLSGQLFDIERLEVLRGPQGTLFGRNATGGLIHYISQDASETEFNGYASASYGSYNRRSIEGAVGGSLSSNARMRLAARVSQADGYIESADAIPGVLDGNGQDLGGENAWAARATLQLDLGTRGVANFWVRHSQDNDVDTGGYVFDNCVFEANGFCSVDTAGLSAAQTGVINGITGAPASPFDNFSNDRGSLDREVSAYQADFSLDLTEDIELVSITNFTELTKSYAEDGDALPITVIRFGTTADYSQFSQELRLSGESGPLTWQAGAYYLNMQTDGELLTVGAPVIGAALAINGAANDPEVFETYSLQSENWSVFAQAEAALSDTMTLIAGLRYSQDNKEIDYLSLLRDVGFADAVLGSDDLFAASVAGANAIDYGDWAARLGLNVQPNDDLLLFVSYNRGIKGGNWTLSPNITAETFQHDAEVLDAYEAGFKWNTSDDALRINGTLFLYEYDDYQAFAMVGGTPQVSNSDASAYGGELEVVWSPGEHWNILLGATLEESSVDEVRAVGEQFAPEFFPGAPDAGYCVNQLDGTFFCDFPDDVVRDAELPNAPRFSVNGVVRYLVPLASGDIALQVDGVYYDDQYLEVTNGLSSLQPGYGVLNLSAAWTSPDGGLSIEVFGKNVLDEEYRAYTLNLGVLGTTSVYGPPSTWGVRFGYEW